MDSRIERNIRKGCPTAATLFCYPKEIWSENFFNSRPIGRASVKMQLSLKTQGLVAVLSFGCGADTQQRRQRNCSTSAARKRCRNGTCKVKIQP